MFYEQLKAATESDRQQLINSEIIVRCMARNVTLSEYIDYLTQAYHHVKFTVPLLMAVGARLPESYEWLRNAVAEYIEEELGHQEWVLNDIAACGGDKDAIRNSKPAIETELMIAYAWDMVNRVDPIGFFGMVHVLEGTSVNLADYAADQIQASIRSFRIAVMGRLHKPSVVPLVAACQLKNDWKIKVSVRLHLVKITVMHVSACLHIETLISDRVLSGGYRSEKSHAD